MPSFQFCRSHVPVNVSVNVSVNVLKLLLLQFFFHCIFLVVEFEVSIVNAFAFHTTHTVHTAHTQYPYASSSSALHLIPISSLPDTCKTFLTSSDTFRTCIDSNGNLYQNTSKNKNNNNNNNDDNDDNPYVLCIAQEDDLPSIATLTIDAFGGADVITLSSSTNLNQVERMLFNPTIDLCNSYSNVVAFMDVLSGLQKRIIRPSTSTSTSYGNGNNYHEYIMPPDISNLKSDQELEDVASKSSVIFALAKYKNIQKHTPTTTTTTMEKRKQQQEVDVIATVELRLQVPDGKIPFSQPWFDSIERRIATFFFSSKQQTQTQQQQQQQQQQQAQQQQAQQQYTQNSKNMNLYQCQCQLQPYLSNLCVDESLRGRQIGTALCRIVECVVRDTWKITGPSSVVVSSGPGPGLNQADTKMYNCYDKIYLHVDLSNVSALNLYKKEGYVDVGYRWNPFWAGKASSDIGYYVKYL